MFKITKAQILHALAGVVFVPVATVVSGWLMQHFPGLPDFSPKQIADFEYVSASGAIGIAIHYLHGFQVWERDVAPIIDVVDK